MFSVKQYRGKFFAEIVNLKTILIFKKSKI